MLLITIWMVSSCSNNEVTEINSNDKNQSINFKTLRDKTMTRYANDNHNNYQVFAIIEESSEWY